MRNVSLAMLIAATMPLLAAAQSGPLRPLPKALWTEDCAAHLLRRAGFGGTPGEVAQLAAAGPDVAVDTLVGFASYAYAPDEPPLSTLVLSEPDRKALRKMSTEERRAYQQRRRRAEIRAHRDVRYWWVARLVESPRQLEERMTLFWHGHFTSGAREVRRAEFMYEQNKLLRRHALGSFRTLLNEISRDRAMLVYLDNARNNKHRPNENYARELLELFTLGAGHYAESDIKAAARAFTGWTFDGDEFVLRSRWHDDGNKRFLGRSGRFDGIDIINIILDQRACSLFLARKLLEHFCQPEPSRGLVERLAAQIRRHDYQLRPVLRVLFRSSAFYDDTARGSLVKSPVDLIVGTARQLGVPIHDLPAAERALASLGQELMQPPNVKGWDGGMLWITSATLYQRYNYVGGLIHGFGAEPRGESRGMRAMMKRTPVGQDRSRAATGWQPAYDPLPVLTERALSRPDAIVDFYVGHLLAVPLPAEKRQVLVDYLDADGRFRIDHELAPDRIRMMIHLLCSTPEYQMY